MHHHHPLTSHALRTAAHSRHSRRVNEPQIALTRCVCVFPHPAGVLELALVALTLALAFAPTLSRCLSLLSFAKGSVLRTLSAQRVTIFRLLN